MLNKKLAKRYAKALIELGKEQNQIERFKNELNIFSDLLRELPELNQSLLSPLYAAAELKKIILMFTKKVAISETVENFLCLLVDKRRIQYLEQMVEAYEDLTNELFGIAKAKITTATPLSKENHDILKESFEKLTNKKILLSTQVDPGIIGGIIAEVGDKIFDGSVRNQLYKIAETLT